MEETGSFWQRQRRRFLAWWRAPATVSDRVLSAIMGAWAGLWIGGLGRMLVTSTSVPLAEVFWFAVGGGLWLAAAGAVFPKAVRCIALPFAFFGVGGGSS